MSRCTKPLVLSLMPVTVTLLAKAQTALVTRSDCRRLCDATRLNRPRRRLKLIWDSTRSSFTFRKFCPCVVDSRLLVATYGGHVEVIAQIQKGES